MDLESELKEIKALLKQLVAKDEPITMSEEECIRISQEKFRAMEEYNKPENVALRNQLLQPQPLEHKEEEECEGGVCMI
jgi:hypothetical protein